MKNNKCCVVVIFLLFVFLINGCSQNSKNKESSTLKDIEEYSMETSNTREESHNDEKDISKNTQEQVEVSNNAKSINLQDNEISNTLENICKSPRYFNSNGAKTAADFLITKLNEYGYETSMQEFSVRKKGIEEYLSAPSVQSYFREINDEDVLKGYANNIIARRKKNTGKKVLYLTAHYDTTDDTNGAIDNGSGVSVVLEIARQLQEYDLPVDIEIVFFSAEEEALQGSTYFVSKLTKEEKENALGCINIDLVGQKNDTEIVLKTYTSQTNILSIMMSKFHEFILGRGEASDHDSFYMGEIPVIYFGDKITYSTVDVSDNPLDNVDLEKLKELTNILCDFIIQFNMENYNNIIGSSYVTEYQISPSEEKLLGYSLSKVSQILKENGAGSRRQYILMNEQGNEIALTEEDHRLLDDAQIDNINDFAVYKDRIKYNILKQENDTLLIQYRDEWVPLYYGVLEGKITLEDALNLIEQRCDFTWYTSLFIATIPEQIEP